MNYIFKYIKKINYNFLIFKKKETYKLS